MKYVRLTKNIVTDGDLHHPPSILARQGDIVHVISVHGKDNGGISVCHESNIQNTFTIYPDEYEQLSSKEEADYVLDFIHARE